MHHTIKVHAAIYPRVKSGEKRFEIRKDDRSYQCGDTVTLEWYEPQSPVPSPPTAYETPPLDFRIGFVLRGGQYGLEPGYVAFQLEPVPVVAVVAPDNWTQHDGKGVPNRARGVKGVEVKYRNGKQSTFFGPAVMPFTLWERGSVEHPEDVMSYRVLSNDWIPHDGGYMPPMMRSNFCIDVKLRDGAEFRANFPNDLKWVYDGKCTERDIIAYKIV